jgi:hypothetical protein
MVIFVADIGFLNAMWSLVYRAAGRLAADPFDFALGKKPAHGFLSGERAGREEGKRSPLQDGELLA